MHIRLNMIVRDEAAVIRRCLESVLPHVDSALIVDTGSTDGTVQIIEELFAQADKPLKVFNHNWEDHAVNRTRAFKEACKWDVPPDYIFWLDAKDVVVSWPEMIPDPPQFGFNGVVRYGTLEYDRPCLLRPFTAFAWSQGVHEALTYAGAAKWYPRLTSLVIEPRGGAASSHDPGKFQKQIQTLQQEFIETQSTRAAYYLAQAYKDAGQLKDAHAWYTQRSNMSNGWIEETWSARLEAAKVAEMLQMPFESVLEHYLQAYNMRPTRAESLYHVARYCRLNGKNSLCRLFAEKAAVIPRPEDALFIEFGVYLWLAKEEAALGSWFSGDQVSALRWISQIDLDKVSIPSERQRIESNLKAMGLA